ncbi:MAG: hypothetical protein SAL70_17445 [Scytonema sp. PMC 1070.18]|nr:hypothetical protein [Scytonema sp. PMC 1070.18]
MSGQLSAFSQEVIEAWILAKSKAQYIPVQSRSAISGLEIVGVVQALLDTTYQSYRDAPFEASLKICIIYLWREMVLEEVVC